MTLNHQFVADIKTAWEGRPRPDRSPRVADAVSPVGRAGPARRAVLRPFRAAERANSSQLASHPITPLSAVASAKMEPLHYSASSRRAAAFTLIELLVVILVIVILAGLMLKMGTYIRDLALQNQAQSEMNAIAGAISAYAADHGYARPPDPLYQALLMGPKKYLDWPAARIRPVSSGVVVLSSTSDARGSGLLDPWGGLYSYKAGRGDTPGNNPSAGAGNMFKTGDMILYLGTSGAPIGQNVGRWYSVLAGFNMIETQHF